MLNTTVLLLILILLSACNLGADRLLPPATIPLIPTQVAPVNTPIEPVTHTTNDGWTVIADGLETRVYIPNDNEIAQLVVVRIDPAQYRFRAVYRPGDPLGLSDWRQVEPEAQVIINANFFDPQNQVQGLLVSDGQVFGSSHGTRGGTFVVQNGVPVVRSNRLQSYQGEPLEQAVQAFPLLVENGQATYFDRSRAQTTRRTIIAQDSEGRILIMATPYLGLSLADLSAYLPTTDMNIVTAFNLDGGGSTMMAIAEMDFTLPSFDAVPSILGVYRR